MHTILVTGACGFIGWKVCEQLLARGDAVAAVDDLDAAYDVRLKEWRLAQLRARPRFSFMRADISSPAAMPALMQAAAAAAPVAAVVHLAARAGVRSSVDDPWVHVATNITGTLNLLELCRTREIGKFVLASTSSLYGRDNPRPYREDAVTDRPLSPYAASKKAAEVMAHTYHALHGIDVAVLRFFTVYGPAGRPDMSLFRFVQRVSEGRDVVVFGDGVQQRDFTYVDDVARGVLAALTAAPGYEIINLGSGRPIVLNDALRLIERLLGRRACVRRVDRHPADVEATWADTAKARRLLGWRPETDFAAGVGALVDWYRGNRGWARDIAA